MFILWRKSLFLLVAIALLEVVGGSVVRPWSLRSKREVRTRGALCAGKEDNVLFALESDCTKYVLCTGEYEYVASCPPSLFYDEELQACNYDEGGQCAAQMRRKNEVETLETVQPETQTATSSTASGDSKLSSTFCSNRPDGTYADPDTCTQYVLCSNNVAHVRQCPPDLVYNAAASSCDFATKDSCNKAGATAKGPRGNTIIGASPSQVPQVSGSLADRVATVMPSAVEGAMNNLMVKMRDESEMANNPSSSGDSSFKLVQSLQKGKPIVKQLEMNGFFLENTTHEILELLGMEADKATMVQLQTLPSPLNPNPHTIQSDEEPPKTPPSTCPYPAITCSIKTYRSFDGSCNNLQNPLWGRAMTPLKRNLPADYHDGMEALRKAKDGSDLPSPRSVSFSLHTDKSRPEPMHTLMLMQWGQWVDHDFTLTALTKLPMDPQGTEKTVDVECGDDGCATDLAACKPISIPANDPVFGTTKKCLMFVRSVGVPNKSCKMGPREQLNQLTSYIDGSQIFGSSKKQADSLRDITDSTRGKLKVSANPNPSLKSLLPKSTEDEECVKRQPSCFEAGDERVNEQTALTSLHVIWLREHNRLEAELHRQNPSWDGERLYQECRKIIGALQQQITYGEFLPVVLGPIEMKKYGLNLQEEGFYSGYDPSVDASASNVFATAAFRFGHSLLTPMMEVLDKDYKSIRTPKLSELFFKPSLMTDAGYGGVDGFIRGVCTRRIQKFDKFVTSEVTNKLFSEAPPGLGSDLVSLNIQRSRDHGIPGYNAWRIWCGLRRANNFDELVEMDAESRETFKKLYRSVEDIDIFPAGLAETPVEGSLLGPTFSCILGREFQRFRKGDRFWYENSGQFSAAQLKEIRKVKLAKIICQNGDNISNIQPAVFESPFREAYPNRDMLSIENGPEEKGVDGDEEDEITLYDKSLVASKPCSSDRQSPAFNTRSQTAAQSVPVTDFSFTSARDGLQVAWLQQLWSDDYNRRETCECLPGMDLTHFKN